MKTFGISNFVVGFLGLNAACALLAQPPSAPGRGWFGGFSPGPRPGLGVLTNRTITEAPFSALETIQTQRTLANGTQLQQQEQSSVNRDSQGRVRIDTTFTVPGSSGSSTTRTAITIYDPVAGYIYRLHPHEQQLLSIQQWFRQRHTHRAKWNPGSDAESGNGNHQRCDGHRHAGYDYDSGWRDRKHASHSSGSFDLGLDGVANPCSGDSDRSAHG
jgi:hypothetical protein